MVNNTMKNAINLPHKKMENGKIEKVHELEMENDFNPFDSANLEDIMTAVGIMGATVDWMSMHYGMDEDYRPCWSVQQQYPTLMRNHFPMYLNQIMLRFQSANVPRNRKTESFFQLLEAVSERLITVESIPAGASGRDFIIYQKSMRAFDQLNKITAVAYYRKELGETQSEVAEKLGISLRQYQRYENTNSALASASMPVVEKLASVLKVAPEQILREGKVVFV